ncbi:hypothetical protein ABFS83_10G036800 [Erythranthe nasuta]
MKITQILICVILVLVIGNKEIITTAEEKAMIIGRLPIGVLIPPSGPWRDDPYIPPVHRVRPISIIGRLPRGVPIPPSGPSRDDPYIPPGHRVRPILTNQRKMIIGRLPKGVPIPPSGPAPYDPNHPAAERRAR